MKAVNLIPSEQRRGGGGSLGRSGGAAYLLLAGLAGLLVLGLLYAVADHQVADRQAQIATDTREADQIQARVTALAGYTQFATLHAQRVQSISKLASARIDWAGDLRRLAAAMPLDVKLISIDASQPPPLAPGAVSSAPSASGTTATPASPAPAGSTAATPAASATLATTSAATSGPTFQISGCAKTHSEVGDVVNRLRAIPGVGPVSLTTSVKGSGQGSGSGCPYSSLPQFALTVAFGGATPGAGGSAATASASGATAASVAPVGSSPPSASPPTATHSTATPAPTLPHPSIHRPSNTPTTPTLPQASSARATQGVR